MATPNVRRAGWFLAAFPAAGPRVTTLLILVALAAGLAAGYAIGRWRRSSGDPPAAAAHPVAARIDVAPAAGADLDRERLAADLARAQAEAARYRQLVIDIENNAPSPLMGPGAPDDLKLIVGVGPVLERMLHQLGVTTFRQIAYWSERDIDAIDAKLHEFPGTHPPRRLGDAGARAAPKQVRRSAAVA